MVQCTRVFILLSVVFVALFSATAQASILLPKNLNKGDREQALRIVGFGTSGKILSDPYPLGGYAGFEFGVTVENLPTEDLGHLGAGLTTPQSEVAYPKISIGKGLFNDVDFFLHFTPYNHQDEMSHFGGIVRYGFFQSESSPFNAAFLAHYNSANIDNLLTTRSYGFDLIGGANVDNVSLYAGFGLIQSAGNFMGSPTGITDSQLIETEIVGGFHAVVGANLHISNYFFSIQMDRYSQSVFSGKLGVRL